MSAIRPLWPAGLACAVVGLLVGCAPPERGLPDVTGEPVPDAVSQLDEAGLVAEVSGVDIGDDDSSLWRVRSQQPRYGTAPEGAVVRLSAVSVLEAASSACGAGSAGDGGRSLVLDMAGEDAGTGSLTFTDVICVLDELETPEAVRTKMGQTTSLDGRVTDRWAGIEASWKYHPDNGLDVILEIP